MQKLLLIALMSACLIGMLSGVDESTQRKFKSAPIYKAKEVEVIRFEAMKPDIERYQRKTDTDLSSGFYQLYKNNLRKTDKVLLNKWLKESK